MIPYLSFGDRIKFIGIYSVVQILKGNFISTAALKLEVKKKKISQSLDGVHLVILENVNDLQEIY